MIKTYKNINISAFMDINVSARNLQNKARFSELVEMSPNSGMLLWKLTKHKYLSRISMFLHKTFRTGLISPSWSKWAQIVVCYDQNLQKHKYLSGDINVSAWNLQNRACFFWASRNESEQWYAMIQNLQKHKYLSRILNVSARNLQNRACFCEPVEMSLNSCML